MKTLRLFEIALLTVLMIVGLSACGGSDDGDLKERKSVSMEYDMSIIEENFNNIDLSVEYYDGSGKTVIEKLTKENMTKWQRNTFVGEEIMYHWNKSVKSEYPAKLGYRIIVSLKPGVDVSELGELFYCSYQYAVAYRVAFQLPQPYIGIISSPNKSNIYSWPFIAIFDSDGKVNIKKDWD